MLFMGKYLYSMCIISFINYLSCLLEPYRVDKLMMQSLITQFVYTSFLSEYSIFFTKTDFNCSLYRSTSILTLANATTIILTKNYPLLEQTLLLFSDIKTSEKVSTRHVFLTELS
jgi:hypothetical protein